MGYHIHRNREPNRSALEIEKKILELDPYLYVDVNKEKPGLWQVWRHHPSSKFPMHILDLPTSAHPSGVLDILRSMDSAGRDLFAEQEIAAMQRNIAWKKKQRHDNEERAKDIGKFIRNNL